MHDIVLTKAVNCRYKSIGTLKHQDGTTDSIEFHNLSQDDMLGVSPIRSNPELILANRQHLQNFLHHAHGIICCILSHLDKHLGLKPGTICVLQPPGQTFRRPASHAPVLYLR